MSLAVSNPAFTFNSTKTVEFNNALINKFRSCKWWELLVHLGSDKEKINYNNFRLSYVKELNSYLKEICGEDSKKICSPISVGTIVNISAESDIDINLNFSTDYILDNLTDINLIYDSINKFHKQHFSTPYTELFDINIYGTHFDVDDKKLTCEENMTCTNTINDDDTQRAWSIIRIIDLKPDLCKSITNFTQKEIPQIADSCKLSEFLELISLPKTKESSYVNNVYNYFKSMKEYSTESKKIIFLFSLAKYYEDDTYRSVGAYLHIVLNKRDLSSNLYMDSFMDNFGFVIENLLKQSCVEITFNWKMLRVAKYLERMIDALELSNSVSYKSDKLSLDSIKKKCNELNGLRKTNSKDESILYKIPLLLTEILNNTNTSSPTDQQATTDKPEEVIKILIKFVFKYYEIKKT